MRLCVNCGNDVPWEIVIDGKVRKLNSRKYCFDCSPFGSHNTKSLHINRENMTCVKCGRKNPKNGRVCYSCVHKQQWEKRAKMIYEIVGTACWYCDYDKGMAGIPILDFHHLDPAKKLFHVNKREGSTYDWSKVWAEMQKCALLCVRCHREVHAGLISKEEVQNVYSAKWAEILSRHVIKEKHG